MITRINSPLITTLWEAINGASTRIPTYAVCFFVLLCISQLSHPCHAWIPTEIRQHQLSQSSLSSHPNSETTRLYAKKNRNNKKNNDELNSWYDSVDDDATPDEVFWNEMERQRMMNQIGESSNQDPYIAAAMSASASSEGGGMMGPSSVDALNTPPAPPSRSNAGASTFSPSGSGGGEGMMSGGLSGSMGTSSEDLAALEPSSKPPTMEEQKAADAALSEYELFQVDDNWLDEDLQERMMTLKAIEEEDDLPIDEQTQILLDQLEALPDGYGDRRDDMFESDNNGEPWDTFGMNEAEKKDVVGGRKIPFPEPGSEFYLDLDVPADPEEKARIDAEFWERLKDCQMMSRRLERARRSKRADAFFSREPNQKQGFDRLWVTALDNGVFRNINGLLREYGVEFADNFGDFESMRREDYLYKPEDLASFKARAVNEVTGLPCVACHTSFEVEPVPPSGPVPKPMNGGAPPPESRAVPKSSNPRVLSGYRISDIGNHVDYICDAMRPVSEPTRVTRFTSCICYYDGEIEIFEYAVLDCDMHFANSLRTDIPLSQAIHDMTETLKLTHGLEFQKYLQQRMDDVIGGSLGPASIKLRDRVLRDGKVLPNKIIDVSKFMDSQVDVNLMDDCAQELSKRFMQNRPTKILTVATTGLVIALPMAKYLQVPVVYARKERNVAMADTYKATYSSNTVGSNRELLVSKSHLDPEDRILCIDDFLSSGATQEALLTIIADAGATAVGVGVLLEKAYMSGRQSLSGFNIPIESLCRVASVEEQSIQLVEEEGFDGL